MSIETFDDVLEDILNCIGTYGCHDENLLSEKDDCSCRCCIKTNLKDRIIHALEIEAKLNR